MTTQKHKVQFLIKQVKKCFYLPGLKKPVKMRHCLMEHVAFFVLSLEDLNFRWEDTAGDFGNLDGSDVEPRLPPFREEAGCRTPGGCTCFSLLLGTGVPGFEVCF